MGVVYEAHDRETDKVVALKTLTRAEASISPASKTSFARWRTSPESGGALRVHGRRPVLVFHDGAGSGINFLEYVRPGYHAKQLESSKTPTLERPAKNPAKRRWPIMKRRLCGWNPSTPLSRPGSARDSDETSLALEIDPIVCAPRCANSPRMHGLHETEASSRYQTIKRPGHERGPRSNSGFRSGGRGRARPTPRQLLAGRHS